MYTALESAADCTGHDDMLALLDVWAHDSSHQNEGEAP